MRGRGNMQRDREMGKTYREKAEGSRVRISTCTVAGCLDGSNGMSASALMACFCGSVKQLSAKVAG
ncbi:hypothetical protein JZ751_016500 [Albula glossodonta]|uniref:Uncharacterized protein n=1 Tax=Albula glossodonta TaxID=121402 RepID=A0A8T2P1F5_9TELE|nr:hypothetical protein JZ751_016500 [Albula glossodonta]